jgi:Acyl-CoA dehydrogenase, N-terminal domain
MTTDYYLLDELLDDEARDARHRVRTFVQTEVLPVINDYGDRAEFPFPLVEKLARLGIIGTTIQGYGCSGLSRLAAGMVTFEMSQSQQVIRAQATRIPVRRAGPLQPRFNGGSPGWLRTGHPGPAAGSAGPRAPRPRTSRRHFRAVARGAVLRPGFGPITEPGHPCLGDREAASPRRPRGPERRRPARPDRPARRQLPVAGAQSPN